MQHVCTKRHPLLPIKGIGTHHKGNYRQIIA
jgi:hypothetical protein